MQLSDAMNDSHVPQRNVRLHCVAFDRFVFVVLGTVAILLLTEQLMAGGASSVNRVLCAVAITILASLATPIFLVVAWLRRKPVCMGLNSLFIILTCVALTCGWFRVKIDRASRQRQLLEQLDSRVNNCHLESAWNVARMCPPIEETLEAWLGSEFFHYPLILGFHGEVDEEICEMVGQLPTLEIITFDGENMNDAWLRHFAGLHRLRTLVLPNPGPSQEAVSRLQETLPNCEISWRQPDEAEKPTITLWTVPKGKGK